MNSTFVGFEELSRSRRVLSIEAEGRGGKHPPSFYERNNNPARSLHFLLLFFADT